MASGTPIQPNRLILLNNYRGTGIGDFGLSLQAHIASGRDSPIYLETDSTWGTFLRQLPTIVAREEPLIANIGLTTWGSSPIRNLLGFGLVGARGAFGKPTLVLLHNVIEIIRGKDSGYRVTPFVILGAQLAVRMLRWCKIATFSRPVSAALASAYRLKVLWTVPIPCDPPVYPHRRPAEFVVVSLGYLGPYKGIGLLIDAAREGVGTARFLVIGGPHKILSADPGYTEYLTQMRILGSQAGVEFLGYLDDDKLRDVLKSALAGILTHSSSSGASASFATLASAGLPVVATDIQEFRDLRDAGAGVLLASADSRALFQALSRIQTDQALRESLVERQAKYAEANSWSKLVEKIFFALESDPEK